MHEKTCEYAPANSLDSPEAIEVFLDDAFTTGNAGFIAKAIGVAARAQGMASIAEKAGFSREHLYRSFSERGNPTLKTLLAVLSAMNMEITASLSSGTRHGRGNEGLRPY